jgi:hypothetical protein
LADGLGGRIDLFARGLQRWSGTTTRPREHGWKRSVGGMGMAGGLQVVLAVRVGVDVTKDV